MNIHVLRLGHRLPRDERITTHVALVSRAFGADEITYSGQHDGSLESTVSRIAENWGGEFQIKYEPDWKTILKGFKGTKVHLTVYGEPIQETIGEIRKLKKDLLIVVGGPKVPADMYQLVDYNISVTLQPHSEVSALAIFLHEFFKGKELTKEFENAKLKIAPQTRGKKTIRLK